MPRSALKQPFGRMAAILFLGSLSVALATNIALPGLRNFDWEQEARTGRELIRWFSQLSGSGSDILPAGLLFILPVFAARWLLPRFSKKDDRSLPERQFNKPSLYSLLMTLGKEMLLVVAISALLGAALVYYLLVFVLPASAMTPAFPASATLAIVGTSIIYFLLIKIIDGFAIADGMTTVTFCGAIATLVAAAVSLLPVDATSLGDMDDNLARALLLSILAVPAINFLLLAQLEFSVQVTSRANAARKFSTKMPFKLIRAETLRLTVGLFLWAVTGAMIVATAVSHADIARDHSLDWLLFPLPPLLIGFAFYRLATSALGTETHYVAEQLRRANTYLSGIRPGGPTEEHLDAAFRSMLRTAAISATVISGVASGLFWLSGATALQALQGLAWIWTIGASSAALLRGMEAQTVRTRSVASLMPRLRWSPARAQFTLLCVTAYIDNELSPEEQFEAMALGQRTQTLHETDKATLQQWLDDVNKRKKDRAGLLDLATHALDDYPEDRDMRRAIYAHCTDLAYADRTIKPRESEFLNYLAKKLRLPAADRKLIDAVIFSKNRH